MRETSVESGSQVSLFTAAQVSLLFTVLKGFCHAKVNNAYLKYICVKTCLLQSKLYHITVVVRLFSS